MAALRSSENLWSVFGSAAIEGDDPFALTDQLFATIANPNVNTVIFHSSYELGMHQIFQPDVGGFGRFAYLPTGERLFVRVRAFFGSNEVFGRALLPIEYGECREITVVVTSLVNPLKQGSIDVIVARYNVVNAPDQRHGAPPQAHRAPIQGAWGISVAPMVLIDQFIPLKARSDDDIEKSAARKKTVSIGGYEALWAGRPRSSRSGTVFGVGRRPPRSAAASRKTS